MGSIQSEMEQIPGAGAPNLARKLTGGPGVGGWDGEGLVWHEGTQLVDGPSFCAEQEWKGGGSGAKDGQALVVEDEEGAIGDHVFDGVVGGGYEIIRGVGCPRLPSRVTRAQGGVVRLRPEIHGVVGVEGMARGTVVCTEHSI